MVALARRRESRVTSEILAEEEGISKKYLDAILRRLRKAGLITGVRGVHGGYTLSRQPDRITAAEVVTTLEGKLELVDCATDASSCKRAPRCPTRGVWQAVSAAVRKTLDTLTLADLAESVATRTGKRAARTTRHDGRRSQSKKM